jgi:hypothetical protein
MDTIDAIRAELDRLDANDDGAGRYDALCRRVRYLARGDEADRVLHDRTVAAWREANPGHVGNRA